MNYKLEICANSATSCVEAQRGGAYRVELCAGIPEGGTTPSHGEISIARELIDIKLHVIIRPRGGDFLFSETEHLTMLRDIEAARMMGIDGIVIGTLSADGTIDMPRNRELIEAAQGLSVTFHRAFDMCSNPYEGLEQIIELGCERILTSGQQVTAEKGIPLIKELVEQADGRIIIMPGCGVNEENVQTIAKATGAVEFHCSARKNIQSKMEFRNDEVSMGGQLVTIHEFERPLTDAGRVHQMIEKLKSIG